MSPEFQDPKPVTNYPPYFVDSDPFQEQTVKAPLRIKVTVSDPNPGDTLYVRWVSDYPPFTEADTRLLVRSQPFPRTEGRAIDAEYFTGNCEAFAPGLVGHRLVVIVSDRPFVPEAQALDREQRYNGIEGNPPYQALMAGWSIIGCP